MRLAGGGRLAARIDEGWGSGVLGPGAFRLEPVNALVNTGSACPSAERAQASASGMPMTSSPGRASITQLISRSDPAAGKATIAT